MRPPDDRTVEVGTTASQARDIARRWVDEHARRLRGFCGAYIAGSVGQMDPDETVPSAPDVDIVVVLDGVAPPAKLGKLRYAGMVVDVGFRSRADLRSAATVLGDHHLAAGLSVPSVIVDPDGWLTQLQQAVAAAFPRREWVVRRCAHVTDKITRRFADLRADLPFADQVVAWVFPTGVLTHLLLVADLRNPTVRRRYVDVHDVLAGIDRLDVYEDLLGLLGCAGMSAAAVVRHLDALAATFDAAAPVAASTALPFATDISVVTRPIVIDGSADLIAAGHHRAAMFWIVATYAKCLMVLRNAMPERDPDSVDAGFRRLVDDLGVPSYDALQRRRRAAEAYVPELWDVAGAVIAANPRVVT